MNNTFEERELFSKILAALAVACGREINHVIIDTYWQSLADMPIESIERAANQLLRTWNHPGLLPTPGQIRQAVSLSVELAGTIALQTLEQAMSSTGVYGCVKFLDETLAAVVESYGGWVEIINIYRDLTTRDAQFWQREFKQRYQLFAEAGRQPLRKFLRGMGDSDSEVDVYSTDGERARIAIAALETKRLVQ